MQESGRRARQVAPGPGHQRAPHQQVLGAMLTSPAETAPARSLHVTGSKERVVHREQEAPGNTEASTSSLMQREAPEVPKFLRGVVLCREMLGS